MKLLSLSTAAGVQLPLTDEIASLTISNMVSSSPIVNVLDTMGCTIGALPTDAIVSHKVIEWYPAPETPIFNSGTTGISLHALNDMATGIDLSSDHVINANTAFLSVGTITLNGVNNTTFGHGTLDISASTGYAFGESLRHTATITSHVDSAISEIHATPVLTVSNDAGAIDVIKNMTPGGTISFCGAIYAETAKTLTFPSNLSGTALNFDSNSHNNITTDIATSIADNGIVNISLNSSDESKVNIYYETDMDEGVLITNLDQYVSDIAPSIVDISSNVFSGASLMKGGCTISTSLEHLRVDDTHATTTSYIGNLVSETDSSSGLGSLISGWIGTSLVSSAPTISISSSYISNLISETDSSGLGTLITGRIDTSLVSSAGAVSFSSGNGEPHVTLRNLSISDSTVAVSANTVYFSDSASHHEIALVDASSLIFHAQDAQTPISQALNDFIWA